MNVAVLVACLYICNCLLGFNATGSYRYWTSWCMSSMG